MLKQIVFIVKIMENWFFISNFFPSFLSSAFIKLFVVSIKLRGYNITFFNDVIDNFVLRLISF